LLVKEKKKRFTLRISTWNVNGLRAALGKGIWNWILSEKPDILCLQEIKTRPDQIADEHYTQLSNPYVYWNPADKPGYSGVATFSNIIPNEVKFGIGKREFDCEGRVISTKFPNFTLLNVYFPSGQRGLERVEFKLAFYAHLLGICDQLHKNNEDIIICGDFNTAHGEIDLRYPKQNQKTSGFLPEERLWIDTYLSHGFIDVYRKLFPDRVEYTWWTYRMNARKKNVGWRLDYFLISEALLPLVRDVVIHGDITGSDHCPVTLDIAI
jgi:exodeoxyribonuclease-3